MMLKTLAGLSGEDGYIYRVLSNFGSDYRVDEEAKAPPLGPAKRCTTNALEFAERKNEPVICCGYVEAFELPGMPIWHCWNTTTTSSTDGVSVPIDVTRKMKSGDVYRGILVPTETARQIWEAARHGDELLDSWRSAADNSPEDVVLRWKHEIISAQHIHAQKELEEKIATWQRPPMPSRYLEGNCNGVAFMLRWSMVPRRGNTVYDVDIVQIEAAPKRRMRGGWFFLVLRRIAHELYERGIFLEQTITEDSLLWAEEMVKRGLMTKHMDKNYLSTPIESGRAAKKRRIAKSEEKQEDLASLLILKINETIQKRGVEQLMNLPGHLGVIASRDSRDIEYTTEYYYPGVPRRTIDTLRAVTLTPKAPKGNRDTASSSIKVEVGQPGLSQKQEQQVREWCAGGPLRQV